LVVISILALLAAILAPMTLQTLNHARRSANYNNLKQIYAGMMMYADDYSGHLPYLSANNTGSQNLFLLLPYLSNNLEILYPKVLFAQNKNDQSDPLSSYLSKPKEIIPDIRADATDILPGYAYCSVDNAGNSLMTGVNDLSDEDDPAVTNIISPIVSTINRTYSDEAFLLLADGTVERVKGSEADDSVID
jgi:type II secretory pathway pseudopilin PulG